MRGCGCSQEAEEGILELGQAFEALLSSCVSISAFRKPLKQSFDSKMISFVLNTMDWTTQADDTGSNAQSIESVHNHVARS